MKETRMTPAQAANLVANNSNTIYGVSVFIVDTPDTNSVITVSLHTPMPRYQAMNSNSTHFKTYLLQSFFRLQWFPTIIC